MSIPHELENRYRNEGIIVQLPTIDRYMVYDLLNHRFVALHILHNVSSSIMGRVSWSAMTLKALNHPNLMPIHEVGLPGQNQYLYWTTPVFSQLDLSSEEKIRLLTSSELLLMLRQVLQALAVAHAADLVHHHVRWDAVCLVENRLCLAEFGVPEHASCREKNGIYSYHPDSKTADVLNALHMTIAVAERLGRYAPPSVWNSLSETLHALGYKLVAGTLKGAMEVEQAVVHCAGTLPACTPLSANVQRAIVVHTALQAAGLHLPVLSTVIQRGQPSQWLADTIVLHINHCLEDVFTLDRLFNALFAKSVFVAVPYRMVTPIPANHPSTVYHARIKENSFELLRSGQSIAERAATFGEAMERLVYRALCDSIVPALTDRHRLLIVEDGGYHYEPLRRCCAEGLLSPEAIVGAVEQTMSGAIRCADAIQKHGLSYPALTIARSNIKMRYETFFIGRRVIDELAYLLYRYNEFLALRHVFIIGYGIIGRSIALSLKGMACRILVLDSNDEVSAVARADGYEVLPKTHKDLTDLFDTELVVIGATGERSFTLSMLAAFAHAPPERIFLVSASSKRVEFEEIIRFFEGGDDEHARLLAQEARLADIRQISIEVNTSGLAYKFKCEGRNKTIVLIARGFPVNFFRGDGFSLTMGMIDPINAELALLANYAVASAGVLRKNHLYVLGYSSLPGLPVREEEILLIWMEKKGIAPHVSEGWYGFSVHPLEKYLRLRRLNDPRVVSR